MVNPNCEPLTTRVMKIPTFDEFLVGLGKGLAVVVKEYALNEIPYYGDKRFLRQFEGIREHEPDNFIRNMHFTLKYGTLVGTATYLIIQNYETLERLLDTTTKAIF